MRDERTPASAVQSRLVHSLHAIGNLFKQFERRRGWVAAAWLARPHRLHNWSRSSSNMTTRLAFRASGVGREAGVDELGLPFDLILN